MIRQDQTRSDKIRQDKKHREFPRAESGKSFFSTATSKGDKKQGGGVIKSKNGPTLFMDGPLGHAPMKNHKLQIEVICLAFPTGILVKFILGKVDICQQTRCHQNYVRIPIGTKQMSAEFRSEKQLTLLNYTIDR